MGWNSILRQASLLIAVFIPGITSIRITNMRVPKFLQVGAVGELDCSWEGENDNMYSIKWYQAFSEFYRFTPTSKEPVQTFDLPTLDVDKKRSWGGNVWIANVTLEAGGAFYCEVSADGPTFHTTSNHAVIPVIDLPDGGPILRGIQPQYVAGDWVDLTCKTLRAYPAPVLKFSVNDDEAPPGWVEPQENIRDPEGLYNSSIRMRFMMTQRVLIEGQAKIQCKGHIPEYYHEAVEGMLRTMPRTESLLDGGLSTGDRSRMSLTSVATLAALIVFLQF